MVPLTVAQLYDRAVLHGGDRVAITHGKRNVTYREMGRDASRLVGALSGILGAGDRVAFMMPNCVEYVICEYAVAAIGATRVPLAMQLASDDHVKMINFAGCKALIYHQKLVDKVAEMAPRMQTVKRFICIADDFQAVPPGHLHLQSLIDASEPGGGTPSIDPEAIAGIFFTGGTTGRPKGVMLSHRSWFHTIYTEMLELSIAPRETFVFCTPMTHAAGCLLLPVLLRQGRCVLLDRFEPGLLLEAIERERATATLLVPTMIYMLLDHPGSADFDVGSLRNVLYGAAPIAPERLKQAVDRYGPIFTQFFGQTEAPMVLTVLARESHATDVPDRDHVLASAGRATYAVQIRLVDDDGVDVPIGQAGELIARSPNMMSGYLDDEQATAAAVRDGWLYTGDVARMNAEGFFTIVDRKKDMIVSGGFNVYPREVEDALFEHPAVRQAAVFGVPHERWGEEVRALVVLHSGQGTTETELIEHVKVRKGSVLAPKTIEFVDAIPLTNLGKIDKKTIRSGYWAGRARVV